MASRLRKLIEAHPISQQELDRRERATRRLRERLCTTPYYRARDANEGMDFWRNLHSSAVVSD